MRVEPTRIAQLAFVRSGFGAPQSDDAFDEEGIPFVRAGSLVRLLEGMPEDRLERISDRYAQRNRLKPYPPGTVLFAKSGMSATKGHIYVLRSKAFVVSHLAALVPKDGRDAHFLKHALEHKPPSTLIKDSAYPSIRLGEIEDLTIQAPRDGADRARVAEILDQAEQIRAKRRNQIRMMRTLPASVFMSWFGDPARNPRGWDVAKLGAVGTLDRGVSKHRPRNDPILLGGPYPLVQTGDVANADGRLATYTSTYSEAGLRQSKLWPKETLCITIAANIGKTAILDIEACFPDSVVGFTPGARVTIEYVHTWMELIQNRLEELAPQSAQKNINLAILRDLPIPVPPFVTQERFSTLMKERQRQLELLKSAQNREMRLFASLQHRAFRGEL